MKHLLHSFPSLALLAAVLSANAVAAPPPAPANVRAIILPAEILFTWNASAGADYYRVYRGGPLRRWVPLSPVTEPRFRDADFVPLPGYYQIAACNAAGECATSREFVVSNVTSSISLIGVTPRPVSDTSFAVAWILNGPVPFTGYGHSWGGDAMLEVGLDLDRLTLVGVNSAPSQRHEFVLENLLPNTTYFYRLTSAGPGDAGVTYWNTFTTRPLAAPPVAIVSLTGPNPSFTAEEDTPTDFALTATSPDGTPLNVFVIGSERGAVWGEAPNFTFLPNPETEGGAIINCGYTDGVTTGFVAVAVTVRHVEDAPIALDRSVAFTEDGGGKLMVHASGWDFDPTAVDCQIVAGPTNGVLTKTGFPKLELQYIPGTNFSGIDHFTFRCFDQNSTGNIATVRIHVTPVNDPPVSPAQSVNIAAGAAQRITLAAWEPDALGDIWGMQPMSYGLVTGPAHGSVGPIEPSASLLPLSVVYSPAPGYTGPDSFSYFVSDGQYTATGAVSIVVTPPPLPNTPANLAATAGPRTKIQLSWTDNSANEAGFKVERSLSATTGWAQIATVGANTTSFTATGQKPNKMYYFRVRAFNLSGDSAYSIVASARARN